MYLCVCGGMGVVCPHTHKLEHACVFYVYTAHMWMGLRTTAESLMALVGVWNDMAPVPETRPTGHGGVAQSVVECLSVTHETLEPTPSQYLCVI